MLAALQRMGREPPPALLVEPEDALSSVRSAILLGAVVPSIRSQTEQLVADLKNLSSVRTQIETEKQTFLASLMRQREEETRLAKLFEEKQRIEAESRDRLSDTNRRAAELAAKATTLRELITSLDADLETTRAAEKAAREQAEEERRLAEAEEAKRQAEAEAEAERRTASLAQAPDETESPAKAAEPTEASYDLASLRRDITRIDAPSAPFSSLKGRLSVPVTGELRTRFGEKDGIGRPASGETLVAAAGALVTTPADGSVLYAGPFRSYGQLLILDAGGGYHVVLAGMSEIDVDVGQFVLAGEPVGMMGARRLASASGDDFDATAPSLYVEFRKDGNPVDPSSWWMDQPSGRTRNDP
ncbi:murein hydrolase activator EnvC family protein [Consotaella aegiceratis]|uniref:murein hydrolase activator EnvC family protein n=1 Tax=Consotaella aegiceratis TaxID=3097961 RepID=UPI002F3F0715